MTARILISFLAAAALAGCASVQGQAPRAYSPDEIIALSTKAGAKPADVVATIKDGRAYYALPAAELARMSKAGVSDEVVNFLQASHLEATRLAERQNMRLESPFWYGHAYGPRFCYRTAVRGGWLVCP